MEFLLKIKDIKVATEINKVKRKGLSLEVTSKGQLKIRASQSLKKTEILNLLKSNEEWIYNRILEIKNKNSIVLNRTFKEDDLFALRGEYYKLKIKKSIGKIEVDENNKTITVYCKNEKEKIKRLLKDFYLEFGEKFFVERVNHYGRFFNSTPKVIKLKEQKRRWGSCTYDNKLLFNWKVIMAPDFVIDYLVVHEMCHMEHKNHGREFWNAVESIFPDYKEAKYWLNKNGITLEL